MSNADDAAVVKAAQAGDRPAFGILYSRYSRLVHAVLLARLPVGDAEDAVQDVFLSAWQRIRNLRDPAAFGGWIAAIARNRAADIYRRAEPTQPMEDNFDPPQKEETEPEAAADARRAFQAIRSLPEAYRETMILRFVEGMTGPEIAAKVGLSHGSVRVNLCRGMQLLREALGKEAAAS